MASASGGAEATTYFVTLRPYLEILSVSRPTASTGGLTIPLEAGPASTGNAAEGADLLALAAATSGEALRLVRRWRTGGDESSGSGCVSTLLLLLTAGGVYYYLVFKKSNLPPPSRSRSRWHRRGWLWWIFGDDAVEEDLVGDSMLAARRSYFGPVLRGPSISSGHSRRGNRRTSTRQADAPEVIVYQHCQKCFTPLANATAPRLQTLSASTSSTDSPLRAVHDGTVAPLNLPATSTPELADDERSESEYVASPRLAATECCHCVLQRAMGDGKEVSMTTSRHGVPAGKTEGPKQWKKTRSRTAKLFHAGRVRRPPTLGGEPWATSPVLPVATNVAETSASRDNSERSSVCGSMAELVRGAREVRRLIREASVDSLTSDYSLGFCVRDDIGASTENCLHHLEGDVSKLRETCGALDERVGAVPVNLAMAVSQSEYSLSKSAPTAETSAAEGSTPDLRVLQWPKRHFWRLSQVPELEDKLSPLRVRDESIKDEELAWESPHNGWHDLKAPRYKLALGRGGVGGAASEYGGGDDSRSSLFTYDGSDAWEWDCEGMAMSPATAAVDVDELYSLLAPSSMLHHQKWLPENADRLELDLEAELAVSGASTPTTSGAARHYSLPSSRLASRNSSRRSSHDRAYYANLPRQPPSGRSSVERGSGDTPRTPIDHAALVKSFGVATSSASAEKNCTSEESGYQDPSATMSSLMTLSPVHEAKETNSAPTTPARHPRTSQVEAHAGRRALFEREEEDTLLQVSVHSGQRRD